MLCRISHQRTVACSVALLFSRKPVARSNAFAAVMNDQGGGPLDVRADKLLTESARVSSNRMRMFRNQTNASKGDGEKWVVRGGRAKKCLLFHFRE